MVKTLCYKPADRACEEIINVRTGSGCENSVRNLNNSLRYLIKISPDLLLKEDGFCGLVVSILATGTRVRGFKPKPLDFSGVRKILSMPSFGGEVK